MSYGDPAIDRIELSFKELAQDVNATSAATRNSWVFFLALQAYFLIALAGISHRDLLLDNPLTLPLLQAEIGLQGFFLFGPVILVLVYIVILLQHVMLARQARELHGRLAGFEGAGQYRNHRMRLQLHHYFFTQLIAGPQRSAFFAFVLGALTWLTLGILPTLLLLKFQVTFLPYHDLNVTWAHRGYLIAALFMLMIFAAFMRYPAAPFITGFGRTIGDRPFSFLLSFILGVGALFFSLSVATVPDERMDRVMTSLLPAPVAGGGGEPGEQRQAFLPTAVLFEAGVDLISGRPAGLFGRNLVVTDTDLVRGFQLGPGATSLNLRRRDLRYGVFDRSDMSNADFTGAVLTEASLRETVLIEVKAERAVLRGADMYRAKTLPDAGIGRPVVPINLRSTDLREANLVEVNLQGANLQGAFVKDADLRGAQMDPEAAAEAARQGAKF